MFILHGDNLVASRKALTTQKELARGKGTEVVNLIGKDLDLTKLKQALESISLLGNGRLVVIENLFSLPKSKVKEEIVDYLKAIETKTELIIWERKQIDGRVLRSLAGKAKIQVFKLPAVIFKFLDSLRPGNARETLTLLHQTLKTEPAELVFYLLARRISFLIMAKDLGKKGLTKMASWQQGRLLYQAEKFSLEQLLGIHRDLLRIDWEQKTGRASLPLASALDLLVVDL